VSVSSLGTSSISVPCILGSPQCSLLFIVSMSLLWEQMVITGFFVFMLVNFAGLFQVVLLSVPSASVCCNWSKQSPCDQRSKLGRPLFLVFFFFFPAVTKILGGVVVGVKHFAWAPNSQKSV
jgi:hypothetical protein